MLLYDARSNDNSQPLTKGEFAMKHTKLRLSLAVLALIVSCLVGSTKTTFAACSGAGCYDKDPNTEGCSASAYTANSASGSGSGVSILVELRYSPSCNSNWTRITRTGSSTSTWLEASVANIGRYTYGTSGYCHMVDGTPTQCADGRGGASSTNGPWSVGVSGVCG